MAPPYLILAFDPRSETAVGQAGELAARLAASGLWRPALAAPGVKTWLTADGVMPVRDEGGAIVVGPLFARRDGGPSLVTAPGAEAAFAGELCRRAWGTYVAVRVEPQTGAAWVFRDPSGALDALCWRLGEVAVVTSDLEGLPRGLAPGDLRLDWDAITDFVRRPLSIAARCGLAGVATVGPGEVLQVGGGAPQTVWRPLDPALEGLPPGVEPGARLRAAAEEVAAGFAGAFPGMLAEVSGGFDSAVVAGLLGPAGLQAGLNYVGDQAEGDERAWARAVCARLARPLLTADKPLRPLTEADFARFAASARPTLNAVDPDRDDHTASLAHRLGAPAIATGYGGDAVFFQMPAMSPVADLLQAVGPRALGNSLAADLARWRRRSIWSVWAEALRAPGPPATGRTGFLGPRACEAPRRPAHPWLEGLEAAPPAKRLQISHLALGQLSYGRSRRGDAAWLVQPCLSQPVLEACLAIPSWRLVEGGRDRALARRVFADLLPPAVAQRRGKGDLTAFYTRLAAMSLDALRPHLLDGTLAEAGVLDRAAMETALRPDRLIWQGDGVRLLGAAAVESWVRHWQTRVPDARHASRVRAWAA